MKYSSRLGIVLVLLLCLFIVDESYSQNCPRGTRCVKRSRCSNSILRSLIEPLKNCGYTPTGKSRICCPEKRRSVAPLWAPITPTECGSVNELQGFRKLQDFPKGGSPAKQGAWPWMVSIAIRNQSGIYKHICAAAMITRWHLLSAASCFERRDPTLYVARSGHIKEKLSREYGIMRIEVPDSYIRENSYDDIAVLTLSRAINKESISPICLFPSAKYVNLTGKSTTSAGWGSTKPNGSPSPTLLEVPGIPVVSNPRCDAIFASKLLSFRGDFPQGITDGFICAGFLKGSKSKCWGESGEPLMYQQGDHWYVVGVLSFGMGCPQPGFPTAYTRVSKYLYWILENIKT